MDAGISVPLERATPCSWRFCARSAKEAAHIDQARAALVNHLIGRGWGRVSTKGEHEICRLVHPDDCLLIFYFASVVANGHRPELAADAIAELVESDREVQP
jgi:hypothetical protein